MTTAIVPTVTGWQGGYSGTLERAGNGNSGSYAFPTAAQNGARPPQDSQLARILKRNGYRGINALFTALIGAASGGTATATHKQVGSPSGPNASTPTVTGITDLGGSRNIETVTDVSRATTAADITWLGKYFNDKLLEAGITYPTYSGPIGGGQGGQLVNGVPRF
jgi:hypothetical protein